MRIEKTILEAERINKTIAERGWKEDCSPNKLIEASGKCIKELTEIIDWYDKNMRNLIKALTYLSKKNRVYKTVLVGNLCDVDFLPKFEENGGDANDPA